MRNRFRTIPTLNEIHQLGTESTGLDVLLVDTNKDKTLVKLQELARVLVRGIGVNVHLMIKKIAELVGIDEQWLICISLYILRKLHSSILFLMGSVTV